MIQTGLEVLLTSRSKEKILGSRYGIVVHPASVDSNFKHAISRFNQLKIKSKLVAILGPQHGAKGDKQDNMIESDDYIDPETGCPVYSLYGVTRSPSEKMLENIDTLVFDIQDVGARYYTFIYTLANCMEACNKYGKKIIVLDRPNPITGKYIEGNVLHPEYKSFVGQYPLLIRHGLTVGELSLMFKYEFDIQCDLEVIKMNGWRRSMWFDETRLPWVLPSPNIPTLDTAIVYPGSCLFEATNISEGRGTSKPFELIGAPFIDSYKLASRLSEIKLPGCVFRPVYFQPTFHKWEGQCCGGIQIHVTNRNQFKSFLTGIAILKSIYELNEKEFQWKPPPYEYEYHLLPIDILSGTHQIRTQIETGSSLESIEASYETEFNLFKEVRKKYLLYI